MTTPRCGPRSPTGGPSTACMPGWPPPPGRWWAPSPATQPRADRPPYGRPDELVADLRAVEASLGAHGAAVLAEARVAPVRRGVEAFGFHLCSVDLRQNADVHEEVVAELLAQAGECQDYLALGEDERVALLAAELERPRPLTAPWIACSDQTASELAILRRAADAIARLRPGGDPPLRHLQVHVGQRPARGGRAPPRGRPVPSHRRRAGLRRHGRAPVRDHRGPGRGREPRCAP